MRVVLVGADDHEADALAARLSVLTPRERLRVWKVEDADEALAQLAAHAVDVFFVVCPPPPDDCLHMVRQLAKGAPATPLILLTDREDEAVTREAMRAGAQDCLLRGDEGRCSLFRLIANATERQEMLQRERDAREVAERAAHSRDAVLSIVSHDLRAPLLTIATCAQALRRPHADVDELSAMIVQATDWGLRIIRDLLDASASETGRLRLHRDLSSVHGVLGTLEVLFQPVCAAAGVTLAVQRPKRDAIIEIDADRIMQAVGNLLSNAIRVSPAGSEVTLDAKISRSTVDIRVADQGPGMTDERLASIFDAHALVRDTDRTGTGLGLSIARGIVRAHGGQLSATSTVGRGSVFACRLPRSPRARQITLRHLPADRARRSTS